MSNPAVNKAPPSQRDSFGELLGQLANNLAAVVHDEIELVKQELREQTRAARCGVFILAIGAIFCLAAFLSLCAAVVIGLASYMAPVVAALVTGAGLALIGGGVAVIGYKQLKPSLRKQEQEMPAVKRRN